MRKLIVLALLSLPAVAQDHPGPSTHTQTAALTPSANPDDYTFDIVAVLASGDRASLMSEGYATVVCNVTGTGLPSGQPTPVSLNAGSQW